MIWNEYIEVIRESLGNNNGLTGCIPHDVWVLRATKGYTHTHGHFDGIIIVMDDAMCKCFNR